MFWLLFLPCFLLLVDEMAFATPITGFKETVFQLPKVSDISNRKFDDVSGFTTDKTLFYSIDNIRYFTPYYYPSYTLSTVLKLDFTDNFHPIVVISISKPLEGIFTVQHLRPLTESYFKEDDVIHKKFFENVIIICEDENVDYDLDISSMVFLLREYNIKRLILDERLLINLPGPGGGLPSIPIYFIPSSSLPKDSTGPYHIKYSREENKLDLFPMYRLYEDYYKTFVNGIYPLNDGSGTYKTLNQVDDNGNLLIPVPSKLYSRGSEKPLGGERTAIKDIFDIKGVPTTAGSRLYASLKGAYVNETASSIIRLGDKGAVIVGKVKTTGYASSGFTIDETPDHLYPFSPRGDQYQSCATSSSGPACSLAAYDWLDLTVGTDTGGSIRHPAALVGLYGNRPTQDIIDLQGVMPVLRWTDTAGIFTRSPSKLKKVLETWYADSPVNRKFDHLPSTILMPSDDLPTMPETVKHLVTDFMKGVENTLGVRVEMINQTAIHPHQSEFMNQTEFFHTMDALQWQDFIQDLVKSYEESNEGRFPAVGSSLQERWQAVRDNPWNDEDFERMKKKVQFTGDWFNNIIGKDEETCSKYIYMEPADLERIPLYRESKLNDISEHINPIRKNPLHPFTPASLSGAPHYIIPIGQVPFNSLVSGKMEMQAVSMSLIAYPGCDFMLLEFIEKLEKAEIIKDVKTGRKAF